MKINLNKLKSGKYYLFGPYWRDINRNPIIRFIKYRYSLDINGIINNYMICDCLYRQSPNSFNDIKKNILLSIKILREANQEEIKLFKLVEIK